MKLRMNIITLGLLACLGGVPQALAEELAPGTGNVPYVDKTFEIFYE